ncbi:pyridoxal phosphate-dependent aminotransferase [Synergistes jonesii]|uniref:pyridoxal phosphate-dependent aminotransferase n=1 Tax=Synergistes jonesii TaxID=2754 RepID=UPI00248E134C|nr:aminotransferase class I/II-fold pyridoxal phosphate-dependent enzyme [Synergistes jonesii]
MEFRPHGANPLKLYELFGVEPPAKIYDFSTNTNAAPQRVGFSPNLREAVEDYPDDECAALRALLSAKFGVEKENLLVTSGSNEAIYIIASYAAARENFILQPVYGEYLRALSAFGAKTRNIFSLPAEFPEGSAVWLCNPCNPTGEFIPDAEIYRTVDGNPNVFFVIDEAYRDFIWTEEELLPLEPRPNVIRLRSLTKIYDMCGARAGCVVADEKILSRLRRRQPSWSVGGLAQQAALFFAADDDLVPRTKKYYSEEMPRLISALNSAGFHTLPTSVNYFLTEIEDDEKLIRFLLERGCVVRHTRNFPSLDGRFVRIAARRAEENDELIAAMKEYR